MGFWRSVGRKQIKKRLIWVMGYMDSRKDEWIFTEVCEGLVLSPLQHGLSECSLLLIPLVILILTLPRETAEISLLTPAWRRRSPAPFSCATSPSHCLVPQTLPGAGKRSRSRTGKGGAFSWNSWSRLSFCHMQSHMLLQMAPCPGQPPMMTNAIHPLRDFWHSLFKSLDKELARKMLSAISMTDSNSTRLVRLDFFVHGSLTDLHLLYHA